MLYDFDKVQEVRVDNFKGGEKYLMMKVAVDDGDVKVMQIRVVPGGSIGLHTHETNCEVVYVISGKGIAIGDGVEEALAPGLVQYCGKTHSHTIINNGTEDLVLFGVVPNIK